MGSQSTALSDRESSSPRLRSAVSRRRKGRTEPRRFAELPRQRLEPERSKTYLGAVWIIFCWGRGLQTSLPTVWQLWMMMSWQVMVDSYLFTLRHTFFFTFLQSWPSLPHSTAGSSSHTSVSVGSFFVTQCWLGVSLPH